MSSLQHFVLARLATDHPEWASYREDITEHNAYDVVYQIPLPANHENKLYFVVSKDEITVKFAVQGSHEHFDPDDVFVGTELERFSDAYDRAFMEYVTPVVENRMVIIRYGDGHEALTFGVEAFCAMNCIAQCSYEGWNLPSRQLPR